MKNKTMYKLYGSRSHYVTSLITHTSFEREDLQEILSILSKEEAKKVLSGVGSIKSRILTASRIIDFT